MRASEILGKLVEYPFDRKPGEAPPPRWFSVVFAAVTAILAIGALDPLWQIDRAATWPTWKPDLQRSVISASGGSSPNYLVSLDGDALLMRLLCQPGQP